MALENYRDLSQSGSDLGAGFQFEFYCTSCSRRWKSPFKPYRMGQIAGLFSRFTYMFMDGRRSGRAAEGMANAGSRGAREKALAEAMDFAQTLYTNCESCKESVCADCLDPKSGHCDKCLKNVRAEQQREETEAQTRAASASANSCPNCRTPSSGGRFCGECGFDMASTHKSCPGCGTMVLRQARFCTDCGHSF